MGRAGVVHVVEAILVYLTRLAFPPTQGVGLVVHALVTGYAHASGDVGGPPNRRGVVRTDALSNIVTAWVGVFPVRADE